MATSPFMASELSLSDSAQLTLLRRTLSTLLTPHADYLPVARTKKKPAVWNGRVVRRANMPPRANYGIRPLNRLFILDLDCHAGASIDEQLDRFTELLATDLRTTFAVETPSGGVHIYLLLPVGASASARIPRGSLRRYEEYLSEGREPVTIDADVRVDKSGYVIGPGSKLGDESYMPLAGRRGFSDYPLDSLPLVTMSDEGFEALVALRARHEARKREIGAQRRKESAVERRADYRMKLVNSGASESVLRSFDGGTSQLASASIEKILTPVDEGDVPFRGELPSPRALNSLRSRIAQDASVPYHERRARIAMGLMCCRTDWAVVNTWRALEVDWDTATSSKLTTVDLLRDVEALRRKFQSSDSYHGAYCGKGSLKLSVGSVNLEPDELSTVVREASRKRIAMLRKSNRLRVARNARVLDLTAFVERLLRGTVNKLSQVKSDAATLMVEYFSPLCNLGAERIVVATEWLASHFGLTRSRVSAALRMLRKIGAVEVATRQITGSAPLYFVAHELTAVAATNDLRTAWGNSKTVAGAVASYSPHLALEGGALLRLTTGEVAGFSPQLEGSYSGLATLRALGWSGGLDSTLATADFIESYAAKILHRNREIEAVNSPVVNGDSFLYFDGAEVLRRLSFTSNEDEVVDLHDPLWSKLERERTRQKSSRFQGRSRWTLSPPPRHGRTAATVRRQQGTGARWTCAP